MVSIDVVDMLRCMYACDIVGYSTFGMDIVLYYDILRYARLLVRSSI